MKAPQFIKRKYWFEYPLVALQGLAGILDGLIMFCSLGTFCSSFALRTCGYRTQLFLKRLIKEKKGVDTDEQNAIFFLP